MISEDRIIQILSAKSEVEEIADLLIESANNAGGKDNVSTVVCRI
jgi:serine/threonine protein phosphatase PrpC